jgi:uncharacterized protein YacL
MDIFIIIALLAIAAETTYLVTKADRKHTNRSEKPIFVDTSVLIDGRIVAVAQSGFITNKLSIPRSVIGELQLLADQGDHEKRSRARYGLDVVSELQKIPQVKIEIFADSNRADEGVDNRLLKLAKKYHGSICTIDFNLNKVAQVEKIPVLNVNDLAMNLRMAYLPGERIMLELAQKGNDSHQAIGHLKDGTMVVVEQASNLIGKSVEIEFIRSLQTAAGKMMFAKVVGGGNKPTSVKPVKPSQPRSPRQQTVKTEVKQPEQPRVQPAQPPRPKQPQRRRKFDKEDSLIALVNQQDE